jgi:superfamily II DNA helicase RecQ
LEIKIFTVPIHGSDEATEALNRFLRGHKILQVEQQFVSDGSNSSWTFCVRYIEEQPRAKHVKRVKRDFKSELTAEAFARFVSLRKVRKQLADEDAVPAFAIFTDEQMAELAKLEELNLSSMQTVKGIGNKKVAKYGQRIMSQLNSKEKGTTP